MGCDVMWYKSLVTGVGGKIEADLECAQECKLMNYFRNEKALNGTSIDMAQNYS